MKKFGLLLISLAVSFSIAISQQGGSLMPLPKEIKTGSQNLLIDKDFSIVVKGLPADFVYDRADDFLRRLAGRTGLFIQQGRIRPSMNNPANPSMEITVDETGELDLRVDESYSIHITQNLIKLHSKTSIGTLRGLETLIQWLNSDQEGYYFAEAQINDSPRFPWRGLLIDPARHWLPVDVIKRNIDGMAAVKMNVLHLHLTEDQGFRIESKVFPKLHELGGEGMYYTQEQMKDIIRYAADRGIRVVPEFDIPGHATSWLVGYPELATVPGKYSIEREWGVMNPVLDPSKESTYEFLDAFLTEMAGLFPDTYLHIGGDENNGKHWKQSKHIQKFMKEKGIKDNHELQAMFNKRLLEILTKNGKQMVGWDEIQHPDISKNVVIQSWRGQKGLAAAAKAGYSVMLSNGYYIDLIQPASFHYLNDPLPDDLGLTPEQARLVLGGEATMWGEQVTHETIDSRIWPRTAAIAERLWSKSDVRDVQSMYARMDVLSLQLEELGLTHEKNYNMMLRRLCRGKGVQELRTLADVVESVKRYGRNAQSDINALMPYTRFVDATRPDAPVARNFNLSVERLINGGDQNDLENINDLLNNWYANHQNLTKVLDDNPILHEIKPLANNLQAISFLGLQAVKYLQNNEHPPEKWRKYALKICKQAKLPYGETELMVVSGIEKLINSTK
ncbi:MAG: family 20 glycosylhydrolase [Bacteroidales bacterium]|nr:family 20 glycosylhydrolase [Bacteroidales bacterium]